MTMQVRPHYDDVVGEVSGMLLDRAARATEAGVTDVWIDPGIGFGKTIDHNLTLLGSLGDLVATGYPVMVGTSRKSFLASVVSSGGSSVPVGERLPGSVATATWAMAQGARMVRVHDVAATVQAAVLVGRTGFDAAALEHGRAGPPSEMRTEDPEVGA